MDQEKFQRLSNRRNIKRKEAIEKKMERDKIKRESTLISAISRLKEVARRDTWCTSHSNCFKASFSADPTKPAESDEHRDKKYELWCEYRKLGATVFVELILADGSRPDLVVCWNNGTIEIVEVVESEGQKSLLLKEDKYPFPMRVVRCDE